MLKIKNKHAVIVIFSFLFGIFGVRTILSKEGIVVKKSIYEEILSVAKKEKWKKVFGEASEDGKGNIYKIHFLDSGKELKFYRDNDFRFDNFVLSIGMPLSNGGEKVAFWIKEGNGHRSLCIVNSDGSNLRKIVTNKNGSLISWSPDGKKIIFRIISEEGRQKTILCMVDVETLVIKELLADDNIFGFTGQAWSPDGNEFVYGYFGNESKIMKFNLLTNKSQEIGKGTWPIWSPVSNEIAFLNDEGLNVINLDTLKIKKMVDRGTHESMDGPIYWFPNGKYIFYSVLSGNEVSDPYVVRASDKQSEAMPDAFWTLCSWSR